MSAAPRICATIEARMTSTRLPGKVLMEAAGKPMLAHMIARLQRVPQLDDIIVATTVNATDDPVAELAEQLGVGCYRGSEHDVLDRVLSAAQANNVDLIVETTGDCPLIDPAIVSEVTEYYLAGDADYVSNALAPRTYPVGMDTQIFATHILADVAQRTDAPDDREHVSLFIYNNPDLYKIAAVTAPHHHQAPETRLTLDTPEDLKVIRRVFEALYPAKPNFDLSDMLTFLDGNDGR
ncbi:MAG: glycosyltransferase family protein [Alphaproteobacteria bacterium]|jgi:spore coat polysaccharide biosynthesis protein SpsF|nr:glycosyltransferase family protein [Alphaproteobacteria bacterium]